MQALRKLVGGTRRRIQDDEVNVEIDLSYIVHNRIIVMSYPASKSIQKFYRNNYKDVKKFLDYHHPEKYNIYNLSEQEYEASLFDGRVYDFAWQDHHAPPFYLLFELVDHMFRWLNKDDENVVVIHCNSGKGRAGTACTCLLLYIGAYDNIKDCAKLFGARRFTDYKGISQPCQVRFVHYFEAFYKNKVVHTPQIKNITKIRIVTVPGEKVKPFFEIYQVNERQNEIIYTNKSNKDQVRSYYRYENGYIDFSFENPIELYGSILIVFKNLGLSIQEIFRVTFNTAFIGDKNHLQFSKYEISPESIQKDNDKFQENFQINLYFQHGCENKPPCKSYETKMGELCRKCQFTMKDEIKNWEKAHAIIDNHVNPTVEQGKQLLKEQKYEYIQEGCNKQLIWNSQNYFISKESLMADEKNIQKVQSNQSLQNSQNNQSQQILNLLPDYDYTQEQTPAFKNLNEMVSNQSYNNQKSQSFDEEQKHNGNNDDFFNQHQKKLTEKTQIFRKSAVQKIDEIQQINQIAQKTVQNSQNHQPSQYKNQNNQRTKTDDLYDFNFYSK